MTDRRLSRGWKSTLRRCWIDVARIGPVMALLAHATPPSFLMDGIEGVREFVRECLWRLHRSAPGCDDGEHKHVRFKDGTIVGDLCVEQMQEASQNPSGDERTKFRLHAMDTNLWSSDADEMAGRMGTLQWWPASLATTTTDARAMLLHRLRPYYYLWAQPNRGREGGRYRETVSSRKTERRRLLCGPLSDVLGYVEERRVPGEIFDPLTALEESLPMVATC